MACLDKLLQLHDRSMIDMKPTIVLLDTPHQDFVREERRSSSRSPSPTSEAPSCAAEIYAPDEELYGLNLLRKLITEAHLRNIAKLVIPIPIISHRLEDQLASGAGSQMTDGTHEQPAPLTGLAANRPVIRRCLELGAADVIISPLSSKCIATLEICAYRAHRDATREQQTLLEIKRGRQRSWVGVNEEKPFAYLREAMVSGLMKGICRLGPEDDQLSSVHVAVSTERQTEIAKAVALWHFSAHLYTDDELVVAAMIMFKHTLSMPDLEKWRIPAGKFDAAVFTTAMIPCKHPCRQLLTRESIRPIDQFPRGLPGCIQQLCTLSQLPPCRRCAASHLQLPRPHWLDCTLSGIPRRLGGTAL